MSDLVHVKGLSELQKFLDQLPAKVEKNVLRGALRAGANVVRADAVGRIHSRSGVLAKSLKVGTKSRGSKVTAAVRTKVFYAKWVEYGTKPHVIKASDGGALAIGGGYYKAVNHPGIVTPYPFMRPALDTKASAAVMAAGEYIKARLATKHGLDTSEVIIEEVES